ncbi:hypothetical protein MG293_017821 [Ovis ammon polii]|uniref:Uncharacterized protein n=1 Tax=Ovis ammon polii TaxID=230172 RepID=A0AAD4Y414_OVIAM|nr:hypothetical protein MG293_017821 [Ovis ammon polii]
MRDRDDASRTRTALSRGLNGFTRWEQCLATPSPMNTRRCPRHGDIGKGKQALAAAMARRPGHLRGRALLLYYSPAYSQASGVEHYAPPSFPGKRPGQVFTYDGQQDAAGVSAGGPETHVMRPKGDGATAVTARTARQRLEREERPQVMAPPPWGLRVLTFWTSDLSGPSWQKERGTRSQGEEKRNPDASSAHASTLCPALQFPSVASARRVCVAGPMGRPPQNTPGLGHQAEPFPLTTLRGHDPQWARCTETITPSSLPKPLEITCGPSSCSSPEGRFSRPLTPRALNWGYLQYGQKASPGSLGALLTRLTPLSFPDRVRAAVPTEHQL